MKATQKQTKKTTASRGTTRKVSSVRAVKAPLHKKISHHAKRALVPHKANNYRPHLIRWYGIAAVLLVAVIAQFVYSYATTGSLSVLGRVSDITTVELLEDTNKERQLNGTTDLKLNDKLSQAAFMRAQDMFAKNYWSHTSPTGEQPWKWFADVEYNYSYAGENLAKNYPTAEATVAAWMDSPTHRENIVNKKYAEVGFAVVDGTLNGQNTTLVVALYGTPVTVAALGASDEQASAFSASSVAVGSTRPFEYFGNAVQSLSPVTIAILGLLAIVGIVGVAAHHYRNKLPKAWRQSWKVHHGMYTFTGMLLLGVLIIIATGGGQI